MENSGKIVERIVGSFGEAHAREYGKRVEMVYMIEVEIYIYIYTPCKPLQTLAFLLLKQEWQLSTANSTFLAAISTCKSGT